ncbi:hypothetical protein [Pseudomonas sp. ZB1P45]|uniref:hypothetical protein n=1 Tax=Pseudomonas frigoris TaxID=3398356 RepID=UPI0039EE6096
MAFDNSISAQDDGVAVLNTGPGSVNLNIVKSLSGLPSVLNPLIIKIVEVYRPQFNSVMQAPKYPETEVKITFNRVKIYAEDLREQSGYMALIESLIDCIDDESPLSKETFLWAINQKYKDVKKKIFLEGNIDPLDSEAAKEAICQNSDKIISLVSLDILSGANVSSTSPVELVKAAKELIVCYGFINCKILEEPV